MLYTLHSDFTGNFIVRIFPKPHSITSPGFTGPAPAGDPVNIKSPGSSVMYCDTKLISWGIVKRRSEVVES